MGVISPNQHPIICHIRIGTDSAIKTTRSSISSIELGQCNLDSSLALFGSLRIVHEPILNSFASKRIVDLFSCSLLVFIILILPILHFLLFRK